jgi:phosphoribosylaminoimidazole-succinocarboxamide synthase
MIDKIPFKGESICRTTAHNFELVKKLGIKTHFIKSISTTSFQAKLVRVLNPENTLKRNSTNFLIPLEVIFRRAFPKESSMLRRLKSGEISIEDVGLKRIPKALETLKTPILDYTTKLEKIDRHLSKNNAQELAALSDKEMLAVNEMTLFINDFISKRADEIGIGYADGKIELAMGPKRELLLVDDFGNLDENKFFVGKTYLSNQIIADASLKTNWGQEMRKAEFGLPFKQETSPSLPKETLLLASDMHKSFCEAWTGKKIWGAPKLEVIADRIKEHTEKIKASELD